MFGAHLDERVNRADCHLEADTFVKNADDVVVGAALPPKLADEFAMSFEFGANDYCAIESSRERSVGSMIFRLFSTWPSQFVNCPITRLYSRISALERYP